MNNEEITTRLRALRGQIEREAGTGVHQMDCAAAAVLDDVCYALRLTEAQRLEILGAPAFTALGPRRGQK